MKITIFIASSAFIILLHSCASLYVPNSVNTPLLTEKNEATINVTTGMNGWDLQTAYSPFKHLGIMINTSGSPKLNNSGSYHRHAFAEGALGFTTKTGSDGVFEIYMGGGYGTIETKSKVIVNGNSNIDKVSGQGTRYFIQPSIGVKKSNVEFAFTIRGVYTELDHVVYNNSVTSTTRSGGFIEPAFTIRNGEGRFMFQTQVGGSIPFNLNTNDIRLRPFIMSFGFCVRLGKQLNIQ